MKIVKGSGSPDAGLSAPRSCRRGSDQQPLLHCPVQGAVEYDVDASYRGPTEPRVFLSLLFLQPPILQQVLVELLNLPAGEFVQLDTPNPGDGVFLHGPAVVACCGRADVSLAVGPLLGHHSPLLCRRASQALRFSSSSKE